MNAIVFLPQPEHLALGSVLDRPFAQHLVEQLVHRGVTRLRLALPETALRTRELLGDGSRWGIEIDVWSTQGTPGWVDAQTALGGGEGPVLMGNGSRLPFLPHCSEDARACLYFETDQPAPQWTGWALLPADRASVFCASMVLGGTWREASQSIDSPTQRVFIESPSLGCATERDLLQSNRTALDNLFPGLFFYGKSPRPGVWIGRGAKVDEAAIIEAPCYIGEGVRISARCSVGPYAVLSKDCVVERGATVARSVVAPDTYVGPDLDVLDSVVDGNRLFNVRLGHEVMVEESHVLSRVLPSFASMLSRVRPLASA